VARLPVGKGVKPIMYRASLIICAIAVKICAINIYR
jgi:hypothetical protein